MSDLKLAIRAKRYPRHDGSPVAVFDDFALSVPAGQFLAIAGPSGCGKTTLLNIAAGLDLEFDGDRQLGRLAGGAAPAIGYMFQEPRLLPWRTVAHNVELAMGARDDAGAAAQAWLARVGLPDAGPLYPRQLSLGMARRAALARAFCVAPDLLLMDEPFASLDEATADDLRQLLREIAERTGGTILFVTHNVDEAVRLADRIVMLAGQPAAVARDVAVDLRPADRQDPEMVRRFRDRLREPAASAAVEPEPAARAVGGGR
ncbi:ABC transporter ATP-binding protein [Rhodovibrio sodomensis]|nr:ABC transporter ATP-binding protein [Rhodovibrio sodomensis]